MHDFSRLLHRADVTTAMSEIASGSTVVVSCFPEGEWNDQGISFFMQLCMHMREVGNENFLNDEGWKWLLSLAIS